MLVELISAENTVADQSCLDREAADASGEDKGPNSLFLSVRFCGCDVFSCQFEFTFTLFTHTVSHTENVNKSNDKFCSLSTPSRVTHRDVS